MKKFIFLSIFCTLCIAATAQPRGGLGNFETEVGAAVLFTDKIEHVEGWDYEDGEYHYYNYDTALPAGGRIYGELRYNINRRLDAAAQLAYAWFSREGDYGRYNTLTTMALGDYNCRLGGVNMFMGAGVGVTKQYYSIPGQRDQWGQTLAYAVRCGIEIFDRLRMTVDCRFDKWGYSHTGVALGWVFGGGNI
jgi:opacity protein-like surface antigen